MIWSTWNKDGQIEADILSSVATHPWPSPSSAHYLTIVKVPKSVLEWRQGTILLRIINNPQSRQLNDTHGVLFCPENPYGIVDSIHGKSTLSHTHGATSHGSFCIHKKWLVQLMMEISLMRLDEELDKTTSLTCVFTLLYVTSYELLTVLPHFTVNNTPVICATCGSA